MHSKQYEINMGRHSSYTSIIRVEETKIIIKKRKKDVYIFHVIYLTYNVKVP